MKRKLSGAGLQLIIWVMLIIIITGGGADRIGELSAPAPDQHAAVTEHQPEAIQKTNMDAAGYEAPIYLIPIPENTQREIWKLCAEKGLAYELVLAILQTDVRDYASKEKLKAAIEELAYFRDYWAAQDYPDETVFDLLILSAQRGIEGCQNFIANNHAYRQDEYLQYVTAFKYYLDQIQDANDDTFITEL